MNWIIIALALFAILILLVGVNSCLGRAARLREMNAQEAAYMERWSTWAEQTKVGP